MRSLGPLRDHGHVVILGAGPAGTACALKLERRALELGRPIRISIVEGKQFSGELHYNQCVGVLSPPLPSLMEEELEVPFPGHLGRASITGYVLHGRRENIALDDREPSIALRRVQFDAYMLEAARKRGIQVVPARAVDVDFHGSGVVVYTESGPIEADLVVGAFGLDEGTASMFARLTGYRPPQALTSVVTKYHPGLPAIEAFGPRIHAFLPGDAHIEFGGITPKGNHFTINIAGKTVDARSMQTFLARPEVAQFLENLEAAGQHDPNDMRFFKGRFPCGLARHYYGDRYVMVGDAAGLVRAFKGKGVTSAVLTGIRAAASILEAGISRQAFHGHYRLANQDILRDVRYGKLMRLLTIFMARYGLLDRVLRAADTDRGLQSALHGAVSAHAPYREVLRLALAPHSLLGVGRAILGRRPKQPGFHHPEDSERQRRDESRKDLRGK